MAGAPQLYHAFRFTPDRSWPEHPFAAQGLHELVYVDSGRYRVDLADGRRAGGPGSCFVLPGDLPHRPPPTLGRPVLVCVQWRGPRPAPGLPLLDGTGEVGIGLGWLLRWMPPERPLAVAVPPAHRRALDHLLAAVLHAVELTRAGDAAPAADPVDATRRYLETHLRYAHRLDDLGRHVDRSPAHLSRAFAARYGLPPLRYLQRRRLSLARDLLRGGTLPVRTVADRVGYPNYEHFSRLFKRAYGLSPSAYRRRSLPG